MTRLALRNPVAILMISVAIVVLGYVSLTRIPVDLFPNISIPVVVVGVVYPGAGPKDIEASITQRLERAVASVPNVRYIESTSRQGIAIVRVMFNWGANVDVGASDCINKVQQIMSTLPQGAQQPFVIKMDITNIAVVGLSVTSSTLDDRALYDLAYNVIQPQLEHLEGVASAGISGGLLRQINILTDRRALQARGLTTQDIVQALAQANFLMPSGNLRAGEVDYNLFTLSQISDVDKIGDVVIKVSPDGSKVHIRDVADVVDGAEDQTNIVRVNQRPAVNLWVRKQPNANTIDVVDRVLKAVPNLYGIPEGVEVVPTFDQSTYIRNSIKSLVNEALSGAILAVIVIFLFLQSIRSTFIISISIPLSIMGAFMLLHFLGSQSLNVFTLGGLALGVGRVVDDSIVVLENTYRHLKMGKKPLQAALLGAQEVAMPVLASTIATVVVFFPVVYLTGIAKQLFTPLSLAIVFTLVASYFVAMAVVPPLAAKVFQSSLESSVGAYSKVMNILGRGIHSLDQGYATALRFVLGKRLIALAVILVAFVFGIRILGSVGTEFFPKTDESQFQGFIKGPLGQRVEVTSKQVGQLEQVIRTTLGSSIVTVVTESGVRQSGMGAMWSANTGPHAGNIRVRLVPPQKRTFSDEDAVEMVRKKAQALFPGLQVFFDTGGIVKRIMNIGASAPIDVEVIGYDFDRARELYTKVREIVESTEGTKDVQVSREDDYPEIDIEVDREKAAMLGITARDVANSALTSVYGNMNAPGIYTDPITGNEFYIVVRLKDEFRASLHDLEDVLVPSRSGSPVLLRNIAKIRITTGPVQIDRKYQQRIVHVTANVVGRPLGDVAKEIEEKLQGLSVPEGFEVRLGGQREEQKESFKSLFLALALALMLVYMTMASQFKSLREPFIVMFSVPMGLIGVAITLYLTKTPLSINAFMGIIMMVGIVLSNGILLVEFANSALSKGATPKEAVIEAGRIRLRPILMTTLTTIVGMLPMAIGIGEGSESNVPLARAVTGGLVASTVFTLFLIPILYTFFVRKARKTDEDEAV
jgi:hydrophobe/amphiphile efflux-1 (HAE1) family protein